ncbi:MAG TPA: hypothetical protein VLL04_09315, partial [Rhizomicrobium sp.]|nr:hypothetical protein [Rhizomicrobium sp.]
MVRLDQRADAFHRSVVGQDRAQQGLLDIDVVGDVAIGFLFNKLFCATLNFLSHVGTLSLPTSP